MDMSKLQEMMGQAQHMQAPRQAPAAAWSQRA